MSYFCTLLIDGGFTSYIFVNGTKEIESLDRDLFILRAVYLTYDTTCLDTAKKRCKHRRLRIERKKKLAIRRAE